MNPPIPIRRASPALLLALLLAACKSTPPPQQIEGVPVTAGANVPCQAHGGRPCIAVIGQPQPPALDLASAAAAQDLAGSGYALLDQASAPPLPRDFAALDYDRLASLGVDYALLQGRSSAAAPFTVALADVRLRALLFATPLSAAASADARRAGHIAADLLLQRLTGVRGLNGTAIAYISATQAGRGRPPVFHLMVANADGSEAREWASSGEPLMTPAWSPDGGRLAYVGYDNGRSAIFILDLASGERRKLVEERGINSSPAWSPDGTRIAATLSLGRNPDIYVIDLASGGKRRLTSDAAIETETTWSPDGRTLAFTSDRSGTPRVYTMSADGGPPRPLPELGRQSANPCYSPDGRTLAMVVESGGRFRVGLLRLDSGRYESLSSGPRDEKPSFAPNGTALVFASQDGTLGTLKVRRLDGTQLRELRDSGDLREPAWSPFIN
ncbi:MAG TPA: DPP IV N-terminal domain-containing protein [Nevskia sp.]|nr:DPP IV N-terminal domain-containing protein [Nevskia sp.]